MKEKEYLQKEPYPLYINGEFVKPKSREMFDIINPSNQEKVGSAYQAGIEEVNLAISSAREAFDKGPWGRMSPKERSDFLFKAADLLKERIEEFSYAETVDCGKIYAGVLSYDAHQAVDAFRYYGGKARCLDGKTVSCGQDVLNYVEWYPHGVVAEILPWNGPLMMGCQKVAAILAAGNTVVIKPSSWAALSMLKMAEVLHGAGFPKGVVNIITGPGHTVGEFLVKSPFVDMVSMTGGTETGKKVIEASAKTVKDVALELGGKSPLIIFEDADFDAAVKWARFAFTLNSGQVCVSGTRLFLQESIYEEFLGALKKECEKLIPGDGFDAKTTLSSLIHKVHADKVWQYIEQGKKEGAKLICGGHPYDDEKLKSGHFVPATVFAEVDPKMTIFQQEIFGPVLCVTKFKDEEEAIQLSNMTQYGLAGGIFSKDIKKALRVARTIRGGQIYVNSYFSNAIAESPGTGWKESGIGVAGIQKYMTSKTTFVNLSDQFIP